MNYIPAIYFSILTFILLKKRGIDACSYISFIYMTTSILAIAIDVMGIERNLVSFASLLPTIVYCILLTLFIIPIALLDFSSYDGLSFRSQKFIRWLNYIFFITFVGYTLAYFGDLKFIITYGDWSELKQLQYDGDGYALTQYSSIIELFLFPIRILANGTVIMVFVFFFNITFLKEKWWINAMAALGSVTVLVDGILFIDRASTFFWVLLLGLALATFWKHMSQKIKSVAIGFSVVLVIAASAYALSVTNDRFGERDGGSHGGIVLYLGQPYYHFCRIWDYYPAPDGVTTKSLFSSFHKFVLHDFNGSVPYQVEMGLKSNMDLGVFYTHLGSFILSAGKVGPFMITTAFLIVFYLVFNEKEKIPITDKGKKRYFPFEKLMILYYLSVIPTVGCICYFYESFYKESVAYLVVISLILLKDSEPRLLNFNK